MRRRSVPADVEVLPDKVLVFRLEDWAQPEDRDFRPKAADALAMTIAWPRVLATRRFQAARQDLYRTHGRAAIAREARNRCDALDDHHSYHRSFCGRCLTTPRQADQ